MKAFLSSLASFGLLISSQAAPPVGYTMAFDQEFYNSKTNINTLIAQGTGWGPIVAPQKFSCHTPYGGDFGSAYFSGPQDAADKISPFRIDVMGPLRIKEWWDSTRNHLRSGLLSTMDSTGNGFTLANGYYQACVWIPKAGGTWSAFWLLTANTFTKARTTDATEIDIFETYGDQSFHNPTQNWLTNIAWETVQDWTPTSQHISPVFHSPQTALDPVTGKESDLAAGPHTFGCLISGSSITFDIDDVPKGKTTMPPSGLNAPFYMMVDLAMGGGWPIDDTPRQSANANPIGWNTYPQEMVVYWIRAYAPPIVQ